MLDKINDLEKMKTAPQEQRPKYKKNNFFDELSSTVTEKQQGPR